MVVRVDHVADWQIRQLADFRQQIASDAGVLKSVNYKTAVAPDDKTGITTGFPAFIGNGRIDAISHLLDSEIRGPGRNRESANRQQKKRKFPVEHDADGNTLYMHA